MKKLIVLLMFTLSIAVAQQRTVEALYDLIAEHPDLQAIDCAVLSDVLDAGDDVTCHSVERSTFDAYLIVKEARDTFNLFAFQEQGWSDTEFGNYRLHTNAYINEGNYLAVSFFQYDEDTAYMFLQIDAFEDE